jgi:hypothetical protein
MQEMIELMKNTNGTGLSSLEINQYLPLTVIPLITSPLTKLTRFPVGPAQFGKQLHGKLGVNKCL